MKKPLPIDKLVAEHRAYELEHPDLKARIRELEAEVARLQDLATKDGRTYRIV